MKNINKMKVDFSIIKDELVLAKAALNQKRKQLIEDGVFNADNYTLSKSGELVLLWSEESFQLEEKYLKDENEKVNKLNNDYVTKLIEIGKYTNEIKVAKKITVTDQEEMANN